MKRLTRAKAFTMRHNGYTLKEIARTLRLTKDQAKQLFKHKKRRVTNDTPSVVEAETIAKVIVYKGRRYSLVA